MDLIDYFSGQLWFGSKFWPVADVFPVVYYTNTQFGYCGRMWPRYWLESDFIHTDSYTSFTSTFTAISCPHSKLQQSRKESFPIRDPRYPQSSSWPIRLLSSSRKEGTQDIKESWKHLCLAVTSPPAWGITGMPFPVWWFVLSDGTWSQTASFHLWLSYFSALASSLVLQKAKEGDQKKRGCLFISLIWEDDLLFLSLSPRILRTLIFTVPAYSLNWSKEVCVLSWQISYCYAASKELKHFWHVQFECYDMTKTSA